MSDAVSSRYKEALRSGHTAVVKGRPREAVEHYEEAGRLAGERPLPFISMGSVYLQMRKPQDALRAYDEALRRVPDDLDALRGKAQALEADGKRQDAQMVVARAAEIEARMRAGERADAAANERVRSLESHIAAGISARIAGDPGRAVAAFLAAANGYAQQNQFSAAIEACFRALELRPGAIDVHLAMAGMYLRRGWRAHGVQRMLFL